MSKPRLKLSELETILGEQTKEALTSATQNLWLIALANETASQYSCEHARESSTWNREACDEDDAMLLLLHHGSKVRGQFAIPDIGRLMNCSLTREVLL